MHRNRAWTLPLLLLCTLPFLGSTCTEEKVIYLSVGLDTTAGFMARGDINNYSGSDTVDVGPEIDLRATLDDYGIDLADVQWIKVSRVFYRIAMPEAGRSIVNGEVTVQRVNVSGDILFVDQMEPVDCSVRTDWIEITDKLQAPGVTLLNGIMADILAAERAGATAANTTIQYGVSGQSLPSAVGTNFDWEIKVSFIAQIASEGDYPSF
jgi:hypothetical protein